MKSKDWLTITLLSLLFGSSFFYTAIAGHDAGPLTIAATRLVVGGIVLLSVLARTTPQHTRTPAWILVLMGLLNSFLPISLIAWAQQSLPSGITAILAATSPVFALFFTRALLQQETISVARIIATLVAFVAIVMVLNPTDVTGIPLGLPPLAVLLAAGSSAFAGVLGKRLIVPGTSALYVATGQVVSAAVMATILALVIEHPWTRPFPSVHASLALGAMGVTSTALAYLLYFRLLERVGAANTLLVGFLVPASATLLGVLVLGERLGLIEAGGFVLLILSLFMIGRPAISVRQSARS